MSTALDRMIDAACKCVLCGESASKCTCWRVCWCGRSYLKTQPGEHGRCAHHLNSVAQVRSRFPRGTRVRSGNLVRYGDLGTVTGYSLFPYDNWLRVKYDNLIRIVAEPVDSFQVIA